ncbi:PTS transporter subunit EIIC [Listeria aquatica]|uniref:PTS transporter subunit EIIC n=1 Tax=Listeria aquatica TaxID=1494960 RepID=A0A841ZM79_9LIST|nr:PTS transporter subunit EIIC [Listeria aquatica]MBC1520627.1 PTS transporter subunit EIIC [Listeria aquatica]
MLGGLQKIGKALMLPIAVLPAAGLLNRLGADDVFNVPFIHSGGAALFTFLSLLFAIGISIGLSKDNSGAAGLNGAIVFFILNFGVIGVNSSINMGVFAGFIAGLTAPILYNYMYDKKIFGNQEFLDGKHVAIIINAVLTLLLVVIFGAAWPTIQNGLDALNGWITSAGAFGSAIYGILNRALIPTGLHHVLNTYLWFGYGDFVDAAGQMVHGDINRFFAGDPTAGTFQVGFFPVMMFGLPGAAFAMYLAAKKKNRAEVGGMMLSLAVTAFLTGITEPIEFTFMFIAPFLYAIHAILMGVSMFVTNLLGIKLGFTFSAGAIDFVLNFTKGHNAWQLIPIGLVFAVIYFVLFYFIIKKFNLKTPGREDETEESLAMEMPNAEVQESAASLGATEADLPNGKVDKYEQMARGYLGGLGGEDNLVKVDNCTTRLRLQVKDADLMNEAALKKSGARGVVKINKENVQIIVGADVEFVADKMRDITGK